MSPVYSHVLSKKESILYRNTEEELKHIQKKIVIYNIIGAPGAILLGLGLYGLFGAQGNAFIPILNNLDVVYGFITTGAIIMIWEFLATIPLLKRKAEIAKKRNT